MGNSDKNKYLLMKIKLEMNFVFLRKGYSLENCWNNSCTKKNIPSQFFMWHMNLCTHFIVLYFDRVLINIISNFYEQILLSTIKIKNKIYDYLIKAY